MPAEAPKKGKAFHERNDVPEKRERHFTNEMVFPKKGKGISRMK
jgi:hypothetical protein